LTTSENIQRKSWVYCFRLFDCLDVALFMRFCIAGGLNSSEARESNRAISSGAKISISLRFGECFHRRFIKILAEKVREDRY
jgi:hypothetical protein